MIFSSGPGHARAKLGSAEMMLAPICKRRVDYLGLDSNTPAVHIVESQEPSWEYVIYTTSEGASGSRVDVLQTKFIRHFQRIYLRHCLISF